MTRVCLADALPTERSALSLLLQDLNMQVVGETADWPTTLAQAPATHPDMMLIETVDKMTARQVAARVRQHFLA